VESDRGRDPSDELVVQESSLLPTGKRSPSNPPIAPLGPGDLAGASDLEVSLEPWDVVLVGDGLEADGAECEEDTAEVEGWSASALALEDAEVAPDLRWHLVRR
jgi:hypothetical protein